MLVVFDLDGTIALDGHRAHLLRHVMHWPDTTICPGLTGIQVINAIAEKGETVAERTIRTNLRRLRLEGAIEQREGKWFSKSEGEAPAKQPPL